MARAFVDTEWEVRARYECAGGGLWYVMPKHGDVLGRLRVVAQGSRVQLYVAGLLRWERDGCVSVSVSMPHAWNMLQLGDHSMVVIVTPASSETRVHATYRVIQDDGVRRGMATAQLDAQNPYALPVPVEWITG